MSEMLIYQNENGDIKVDVRFEEKSIWLSQSQLCEVFGKSKATISEHISHIFDEGELDENELFGISEQFIGALSGYPSKVR
ncbi:hypothetical protein [Sulfurovum sp.]|uniref:hypothetical protein n=1 Tax=Sulfurovum sp. TaxID=1969726 RepID=UPI0028680702|nr:hypothetical protein [Sulfurovum sp.]